MHNSSPASIRSRPTATEGRDEYKCDSLARSFHIVEPVGVIVRSAKQVNSLNVRALASPRKQVQTPGNSADVATVRQGHRVPRQMLPTSVTVSSSPRFPLSKNLQPNARKTNKGHCEGVSSMTRTSLPAQAMVTRTCNVQRGLYREAQPRIRGKQVALPLEQGTQARWGFSSCLQSSPQQPKPSQHTTRVASVKQDLQPHAPLVRNLVLRPAMLDPASCLLKESRQLSLTPRTMTIKSTALRLPQDESSISRSGLSLSSPRQHAPWNAACMTARSSGPSQRSLSMLADPKNRQWSFSMSPALTKSMSCRPHQHASSQLTSQARQTSTSDPRNVVPLSTVPQEMMGRQRKRSSVTSQRDQVPPGSGPMAHMVQRCVTRLQTTPASQLKPLVSVAAKGGLLRSSMSLPSSPRRMTSTMIMTSPQGGQPSRTISVSKANTGSGMEMPLEHLLSNQKGTRTTCYSPLCTQHSRDLGGG